MEGERDAERWRTKFSSISERIEGEAKSVWCALAGWPCGLRPNDDELCAVRPAIRHKVWGSGGDASRHVSPRDDVGFCRQETMQAGFSGETT